MAWSGPIKVLRDRDIQDLLVMSDLIEVCARAVADDAAGRLNAPPRLSADFGPGRLVFTVGGNTNAVGFRAYDTFSSSKQDRVVAVWQLDIPPSLVGCASEFTNRVWTGSSAYNGDVC